MKKYPKISTFTIVYKKNKGGTLKKKMPPKYGFSQIAPICGREKIFYYVYIVL